MPGLVSQMSPVEQLPFPNSAYTPTPPISSTIGTPLPPAYQNQIPSATTMTTPVVAPASAPGITRQLSDYNSTPEMPEARAGAVVTRQLSDVPTGMLPLVVKTKTTTALRQPVVIRGTGKKSTEPLPPPRKRHWVVNIAVTCILALIVLASVLSVLPTGSGGSTGFNPFRPIMNLVQSSGSNPALIAQQAATATAVITHQDGYDPGQSTSVGAGIPPPITGNGSTLNRFAFGQCTYWANMRYHALTGYWVSWLGNAYQWAYGAGAAGWVVSGTPRVPSIIVLQPGVQGAGGYGHVAVVERINSDGSVYASNFNWYAGGGGWDTLSYWTFHPGPGVSFVWHPYDQSRLHKQRYRRQNLLYLCLCSLL